MLESKLKQLDQMLRQCGRLIVAYSGGVDSAFLLYRAHHQLGKNCLGVIADSPSLPRHELDGALRFAREHGVAVEVITTEELQDPNYASNPINRCYFCKSALFIQLEALAKARNFTYLAYGENRDDMADFRPGRQAAEQFRVLAPLKEAGLTKKEIREASKNLGLSVFDKPAAPCLSSRIPHGTPVTKAILAQVEAGENFLRRLGFRVFRLRHHGEEARLELAENEFALFEATDIRQKIEFGLEQMGYKKVVLMEKPYGHAKKEGNA